MSSFNLNSVSKILGIKLEDKSKSAILHFILVGVFFAFLSVTVLTYKTDNPYISSVIGSLLTVYEVVFLQFALVVVSTFIFVEKYGTSKGIVLGAIYGVLSSLMQIGVYLFVIGFFVLSFLIDLYNKKAKLEERENNSNLKVEYLVYILLISFLFFGLYLLNQYVSYKIGDYIYTNPNAFLSTIFAVFSYIFGFLGALNLIIKTIAFQTGIDALFLQTAIILVNLTIFFSLLSKVILAKAELSYEAKRTMTIASVATLLFYHFAYILVILQKPWNFLINSFLASFLAVALLYAVNLVGLDLSALKSSFDAGSPLSMLHFLFNLNHILISVVLIVISLLSAFAVTFASFFACTKLCKHNKAVETEKAEG